MVEVHAKKCQSKCLNFNQNHDNSIHHMHHGDIKEQRNEKLFHEFPIGDHNFTDRLKGIALNGRVWVGDLLHG